MQVGANQSLPVCMYGTGVEVLLDRWMDGRAVQGRSVAGLRRQIVTVAEKENARPVLR